MGRGFCRHTVVDLVLILKEEEEIQSDVDVSKRGHSFFILPSLYSGLPNYIVICLSTIMVGLSEDSVAQNETEEMSFEIF